MTSASEHTRDGDNIGTDDNDDNNDTSRSSTPPSLSINRLVALHARERLLVHPLRWTDRQLNLLQCRLHPHGEVDGPEQDCSPVGPCPSGRIKRRLARIGAPLYDFNAMIDALHRLFKSVGYSKLVSYQSSARLYFRQRPHETIKYTHLSLAKPAHATSAEFVCFDIARIKRRRHKHLFPKRDRLARVDSPGIGKASKLLSRITPADSGRDPYLVALIIARAQEARGDYLETPKCSPSGHEVRLLFASQENPVALNIYVAQVQDSFLDRLRFPDRLPLAGSGLDIHHWRISAEPFETLAQRLVRAGRMDCEGKTLAPEILISDLYRNE